MSVRIFLSNTYDMATISVFRTLKNFTGKGQRNIVIVPDKFTLSIERKLLDKLNVDCTFDVEVMSFTRLAAMTMREKINRCLTPEGSVILMREAAQLVKKDLLVYSEAADGTGFPNEIYAAITAMRNGGIFPLDLLSIEGNSDAAQKLKDVGLIYQKYLDLLENRLSDSSTRLYAFADAIPTLDFSNVNFFITDFSDFTAPQYDIIDKMIACANDVTVGLVVSDNANNSRLIPNRAIERINRMCNDRGIAPVVERCTEILPPYKVQILKNAYSYVKVSPVELKENEISLFSAPDPDKEIENVAKIIRHAVVEKGRRYKEFAVVVSDGEGYKSVIRRVFSRYDIPFFYDDKILFSQQPAAKYIISAMKCADKKLDYREVNELIKNPFFYINDDGYAEVEYFDFFVTENSLTRKLTSPIADDTAEKVRKKLLKTIEPFKKLENVSATRIIEALEKFVTDNALADKCDEIAESGIDAQSRAMGQIYDKFIAVLDEMKITLSDSLTSLNDFIALTESVFCNIKIALVPLFLDSVYVGESGDSKYDDVEYLFIVGATDKKFPRVATETAIIGLSEEAEMISSGLKPYPTKKEIVKNNCFDLIHLLIKPKRQLIISYPESIGGTEEKPSTLIQQLKVLFTKNGEGLVPNVVTDERLDDISLSDIKRAKAFAYKFATQKNGLAELLGDMSSENVRPMSMAPYDAMVALLSETDRENVNKLLSADNIPKNIDGNLSLSRGYFSASQMEAYFACPYKQYFKYALSVKPRTDGKLRTLETGTLSHYVMEKFIGGGYYKDFNENVVRPLIKKWIDERIALPDMAFFRAKKHLNTFTRLSKECLQLCEGVAEQIAQSDFKPYVLEAKIGKISDGSKFEGIVAEIDGKKYYLYGSIDRIDCCDGYFTVIDYKSWGKNLVLGEVYNGTKIQPLLYLAAVNNDDNLKYPAGLLYQPLSVGYKKEDDGRFSMKGIVINDVSVLKKMDNTLATSGKSKYIPIKIKKDGTPDKNSASVSDTVLTSLKLYTEKLAKNAVGEIAEGFIAPSPTEDACKFCEYVDICAFANEEKYERKKFPKINGEDFIKLYNGETIGIECPEMNDQEDKNGLD